MFTGPPVHGLRPRRNPLALRGILAMGMAFVSVLRSPAQQSPSHQPTPHPASVRQSPFVEAEKLLSQGRLAEAKQKAQEQLNLHPSSVEGFTLLGIIYSNEKDYAGALDAFQHALTLDPNSTRTHNNLANLFIAAGKVELAEKEFRKVLRLAPANADANY